MAKNQTQKAQTLDPSAHDEVDRDEFEEALRQIMLSPSASRPKSQNREPTKAELEQRYKLTRRK